MSWHVAGFLIDISGTGFRFKHKREKGVASTGRSLGSVLLLWVDGLGPLDLASTCEEGNGRSEWGELTSGQL